jgi:preprotein translocase subunit SecG
LLSRTTAILGTIFFVLSLTLALLNKGTGGVNGHSLLDIAPASSPAKAGLPPLAPAAPPAPGTDTPTPASPAPAASAPAAPAKPGVPVN